MIIAIIDCEWLTVAVNPSRYKGEENARGFPKLEGNLEII
jgi:hypothetical protein